MCLVCLWQFYFFHSTLFLDDETLDNRTMNRTIFISLFLIFHSLKDYTLVITTENLFGLVSCSIRMVWATLDTSNCHFILLCIFNNSDHEKVIYWSMPNSFYFIQKTETILTISLLNTLCKKWSFLLRVSLVNVTKSAGNCGFGQIY